MIEPPIKYSLPFEIEWSKPYYDFQLLKGKDHYEYLYRKVSKKSYQIYLELCRLSKHISKAIYEIPVSDGIILLFSYDSLTEVAVRKRKCLDLYQTLFSDTSFEITLKKEHLVNLNNIYKVLDNKFAYIELRIREIETNPIKTDVSWILLSKYNIVLDAKLYLYDLQTDIFKAIDQKKIIKYGMIPKKMSEMLYQKGYLLPFFDMYYAPLAMLYARYYCSIEEIPIDRIKKLDSFDQKYFCFMVLYIYILNLNLEVILDTYRIDNYLLITKKIKSFIVSHKAIIEG